MSITSCFISPTKALIAVDTATEGADETVAEANKLLVFSNLNAVAACRGAVIFHQMLYSVAAMSGAQSFDDLVDYVGKVIAKTYKEFTCVAAPHFKTASDLEMQDVIFVGWSDSRARMFGIWFQQESAKQGFVQHEVPDVHIAPGDHATMGHLIPPDTIPKMEQLAKLQVPFLRQAVPGIVCGGSLVVAQLQRGSLAIARRGELG